MQFTFNTQKEGCSMAAIRVDELEEVLRKYPWDTFISTPGKQLITGDSLVGGTIDWFNDSVDKIADYIYSLYCKNSRFDVVLWKAYCYLGNGFFRDNWQDEVVEQVNRWTKEWFEFMCGQFRQRNKVLIEVAKLILPHISPVHPLHQLFV
jgi:hypothetical protein